MRFRTFALAIFLVASSFAAPYTTHAASAIPFWGPIIPEGQISLTAKGPNAVAEQSTCPASWGMVIVVINNILKLLLSIVIVFIAPLMIAYAGFVLVIGQGNPGEIGRARNILLHTIVGIVVAMAAWMIVAALLAVLMGGPNSSVENWTNLISAPGADPCLNVADSFTPAAAPVGKPAVIVAPSAAIFTYDPGIENQLPDASAALSSLLNCIKGKLTASARITSISDSQITSGQKTFSQCAASGCAHTANSCHYGGRGCVGKSYAVDLGNDGNMDVLTAAAQSCNASTLDEGNHLHVSIGMQNDCSCDASLD